jgi:hypothetical protein
MWQSGYGSFLCGTTITIDDGRIESFWHTPCLQGRKPKDIAPSIFAISKHKNFTVHNNMNQEFLITKIKTNEGITINHLTEFVESWTRVYEVQLIEGTADDITCKFTASGSYTVATYKAQFEGMINSCMMEAVWKNSYPAEV